MFERSASATFVHRLKARAAGKEFDATAGFRARQDDSWEVSAASGPGPSSFGMRARLHIMAITFEVATARPRAHIRIVTRALTIAWSDRMNRRTNRPCRPVAQAHR
jgi:hypothetical protein